MVKKVTTTTVLVEPNDFWDNNIVWWHQGKFYAMTIEEYQEMAKPGPGGRVREITGFDGTTKEIQIEEDLD